MGDRSRLSNERYKLKDFSVEEIHKRMTDVVSIAFKYIPPFSKFLQKNKFSVKHLIQNFI